MTACVAARHVAGRGLPALLPEHERRTGQRHLRLNKYTMLVRTCFSWGYYRFLQPRKARPCAAPYFEQDIQYI